MSAAHRAAAGVGDHYPTCPSCGSLCGRLAEVCADCGARLYPTAAELESARSLALAPAVAALEREATQATREPGA